MGLKEIQAEAQKARKEVDSTMGEFLKQAKDINAKLADYKNKIEAMHKIMQEMHDNTVAAQNAAKALKTYGIVQLDEMKKLLILASEHGEPHPVNLTEISKLEQALQTEIQRDVKQKMEERLSKIEAAWPKELKVGQTFKNKVGQVVEIITPPAPIPNKPGATSFKVKFLKTYYEGGEGGVLTYFSAEFNAQKGWKFINI